jgi:hypothetical protein
MPSAETAKAALKLDDAHQAYAHDNGDGFRDHDWRGAYDYREEGYRLGEEAFDRPAEDRNDHVEVGSYAFPESARYLIAVAADFRMAELADSERNAAMARAA